MTNATYFPSGSNHQGEIEGLAAIGANVGVAIPEVTSNALAALEQLAGRGTLVFVDSGAFSEVEFPGGVPTIVDEITDAEWTRRLGLYERLAAKLGAQLFPVAPDCVAHQDVTLARLARYADRVRNLRALGANVIVPIQKGALSMAEFDARVCDVLGFDDFVRGIPMMKDATTAEQLGEFIAACPKARRVHLLGLGPRAKQNKFANAVAAVTGARSDVELFCDSVFITAFVGKTNGPGGGPRIYTQVQDEHWDEELAARAFCDDAVDYTDLVVEEINAWAGPAARAEIAARLALQGDELKAFKRDPHAWLQEDDRYLMDHVEAAVDYVWQQRYFFDETVVERKREGIIRAFDGMFTIEAFVAAEAQTDLGI